MESVNKSVQTAFRFRPELLSRLKSQARLEQKTLNAYVESVLEAAIEKDNPHSTIVEKIGKLTPDCGLPLSFPVPSCKLEFTDEELEADPRLEYLVKKHLR